MAEGEMRNQTQIFRNRHDSKNGQQKYLSQKIIWKFKALKEIYLVFQEKSPK